MGSARKQFDLLINAITTVVMLVLVYYSELPNELAVAIVGLVACLLVFGGAVYDDRQAAAAIAAAPTAETPLHSEPVIPPTQPARRKPKPPDGASGTTPESTETQH